MTLLRKEDTAKAAKLIGAVVFVFGLAAWRVAGAMSPARPETPPAETVGGAPATSPTNGAPTQPAVQTPAPKPGEPDALIEPKRPVLGSMIDPFRTIEPPTTPVRVRVARPVAMPMPLIGGPLPPATSLPAAGAVVPVAVAAVEAPMRVTGILGGANATAVVETGKDTCVVREGGHLPDGSEVVGITATTVTLRHDGKTRVLDVGN